MPANIQLESNNIHVLRITGILKRSEFDGTQSTAAQAIDAGAKPRILAILEDFAGWEKGADWNDLEFLFSHSQQIAKIAIVGERRWEAEALAFAGAGFRNAPVRFFTADQQAEARTWLQE